MTYNYEVNCPRYRLNFKATSIQFFFSVSICFKKKKKKKKKEKKHEAQKNKTRQEAKKPLWSWYTCVQLETGKRESIFTIYLFQCDP